MLTLPFFTALEPCRRVLLAGAGGGFDIFCGLPLYFGLRGAGKEVFLANLSFTRLEDSTGRRLTSLSTRRARRFLHDWETSTSALRRSARSK